VFAIGEKVVKVRVNLSVQSTDAHAQAQILLFLVRVGSKAELMQSLAYQAKMDHRSRTTAVGRFFSLNRAHNGRPSLWILPDYERISDGFTSKSSVGPGMHRSWSPSSSPFRGFHGGLIVSLCPPTNASPPATQFVTISPGPLSSTPAESRSRTSRFGSLTCGTSRKIGAVMAVVAVVVGEWRQRHLELPWLTVRQDEQAIGRYALGQHLAAQGRGRECRSRACSAARMVSREVGIATSICGCGFRSGSSPSFLVRRPAANGSFRNWTQTCRILISFSAGF
jgi:hypothetical protein